MEAAAVARGFDGDCKRDGDSRCLTKKCGDGFGILGGALLGETLPVATDCETTIQGASRSATKLLTADLVCATSPVP